MRLGRAASLHQGHEARRYGRSHVAPTTAERHPLEHPDDGQGPRGQRSDRPANLEAARFEPHRVSTFKVSRDPRFVQKLTDVVGLYLNPPDKALVLCVDEKSQIQALDQLSQVCR